MADLALAVDIGGTKMAAGLVAIDGTLLERAMRPTPATSGPDEAEVLWDNLAGVVHEATAAVRPGNRLVVGRGKAVVNPQAFGWRAEAFVDLYCDGKMSGSAIKRAVEREPGVVSAHTVAGEASALLHVMAEDTKDLELALERIRSTQGVTRTVTSCAVARLSTSSRSLPRAETTRAPDARTQ